MSPAGPCEVRGETRASGGRHRRSSSCIACNYGLQIQGPAHIALRMTMPSITPLATSAAAKASHAASAFALRNVAIIVIELGCRRA